MRTVIKSGPVKRAVALFVFVVVAAPVSSAALTPDDALRAFDIFLRGTDTNVPHADANCDGAVTPGDRFPAEPGAATPNRTGSRRASDVYEVTIEVPGPTAVTAFGVRLDYPADQLRLLDAGPGAGGVLCAAAGATWGHATSWGRSAS